MDPESKKLNDLLLVICLLLVALIATRVPVDSDMWWHLKAGELTLEQGKPLLVDTMSYTKEGSAWINHSWLGQVVLYGFYRFFHYWGLEIFVVMLSVICAFFIWKQLIGHFFIKTVLLLCGAVLFSLVLTPRPQLFSLAFLAFSGWYLDVRLNKVYKKAFLLPVLFLAWSNIHAGATMGLIFIAAYLGGYFIHLLFTHTLKTEARNLFYLAGWTAASVAAVAVNPNGLKIYGISFVTMQVTVKQYIQEWLPPDYTEPVQFFFLIFLCVTAILIILQWKKVQFTDAVLFGVFGYLALTGRRNIAPFAVIAVPIMSRSLGSIFSRIGKAANKEPAKKLNPSLTTVINLILVGVLWLAVLGKGFYNGHPVIVETSIEKDYPVRVIEKMKTGSFTGNLLNEYNWGGYLAWEAEDYPVFIDARTDLYGDVIFNDWYNMIFAKEDWQDLISQYDIQTVLLYPDRPLVSRLIAEGWIVGAQNQAGILLYH